MVESEQLIAALKPLGFAGYEAKAYLALATSGAMNGYQLAKRSGVPRSMIYETVSKLQARGAIYALEGEPVRYLAVPPAELLGRLRREADAHFLAAEHELGRLAAPPEVDVVLRIDGHRRALETAEAVVASARHSLTLSIWERQLRELEPALRHAAVRGVAIRMVLFGPAAPAGLGGVYLHHFVDPSVVEARLDAQLMVIAADHAEVVVGHLGADERGWAVRTRDRALVLVSEEYVRHDVVLAAIAEHVGVDVIDRLWRSRADLVPMVTGAESIGADPFTAPRPPARAGADRTVVGAEGTRG